MESDSTVDNKPQAKDTTSECKTKSHNNNHYVVPFGILTTLCTVFLMFACLQRNYQHYVELGVAASTVSQTNVDKENFLAYKADTETATSCEKIEIFHNAEVDTKRTTKNNSSVKKNRELLTKRSVPGRQSKLAKNAAVAKKKDNTKKVNTAEPIIYLFALVFIYLLLKAASDINQHYKSNKADKRLRRCSLQSYAHKDQRNADRRASKDLILMQSRHSVFTEARSISLDRYNFAIRREMGLRQQIAIVETQRTYPVKPTAIVASNIIEPRSSRRCSVPFTINYQAVPVVPATLKRRDTVISLGSSADMNIGGTISPSLTPDLKRRVRMINRH
ncbi:uncharacterized protein LOC108595686 isoform X2 [Drosophila busckii]|uniref:uncharacterized protein LOC108595686 isoform X2 n=1 Tax=Drosophila busckii TaxID=30019 RepID=UPI00083EF22B|nr:uncharacterized protein LOC108595686 isoform X2 [Drosophila busckii]